MRSFVLSAAPPPPADGSPYPRGALARMPLADSARDSVARHLLYTRDCATGMPSVIQLTFHDCSEAPAAVLGASDFRITGGVLWSQVEHGLIACFACGSWKHRGKYYPSISIAGACRLAFGIARELLISEPISLFAVTGTTFRANGVAIAEYDEKQDLWQGLIRPITWQSMRVLSVAAESALTEPGPSMILNPWDYYPGDGLPPPGASSSKYTR